MNTALRQLLSASLLLSCRVTAAAEIPISDFTKIRDYEEVKISPTGRYLAVSKWIGDQVGIVIRDLEQQKFIGAMKYAQGVSTTDFWWVGPDRVVAELGQSDGALNQIIRYGELYGADADGSNGNYLFGYRGKEKVGTHRREVTRQDAWGFMVDPLPRDPDHALISVWPWNRRDMTQAKPSIYRMDVRTGARQSVVTVPLNSPSVLTDSSGHPRIAAGIDKDADCCRLITRGPEDKEWQTLAIRPTNISLLGVTGSDHSALMALSTDGSPTCLHEYRFDNRNLSQLHCNGQVDVGVVTMSFDGGTALSVTYEDGKPQTVYLNPEHADSRLLRSLEKTFGGQRIRVTSRTLDGSKVVILVDSDRNPGDFYLLDRATKKAAYLMSRRHWIDPATQQAMQPVKFTSRDGVTLHGYLTRGAGTSDKAPLVVLPHGGPFGVRDYWQWDSEVQLLASRGYSVLQINFRGSGGYGNGFETTANKKKGTMMIEDIIDGTRWAVQQGFASADRTCIYGTSYGGFAAAMSATQAPDLYRCAVTHAGVSNLASQGKDTDYADTWSGEKFLEEQVGVDEKVLLEQSPVSHVSKLKAPILIVHGTKDKRVPFSQAKELRAALEDADKPYEWLEFKGEEHGLFKEENRVEFYTKLLDFLDRHIGSKAKS